MSGRPGLTIAGLALAGGAGYYLYSAGGDPKVAQKNLEGLFDHLLTPTTLY